MIYIGLDLGTSCGWAVFKDDKYVASGTFDLSITKHEGGGWRYIKFEKELIQLFAKYKPDAVAYELIRRHGAGNNTQAAHVWGGLRAVLQLYCDKNCIPYTGYEVKSIKKHCTGKGNAGKELIIKAVNKKHGLSISLKNDDEADAVAIADMLQNDLSCLQTHGNTT